MHTATIKTRPSHVQGENIVIFICYDDGQEHSHHFNASEYTAETAIAQARVIAKERIEKLNKADELAVEIEKYHEEVVS